MTIAALFTSKNDFFIVTREKKFIEEYQAIHGSAESTSTITITFNESKEKENKQLNSINNRVNQSRATYQDENIFSCSEQWEKHAISILYSELQIWKLLSGL